MSESRKAARLRYELACSQLRAGNYLDGFAGYESRWEAAGLRPPIETDKALLGEQWRGANSNGKRVLLHAEQGFGDTIQFIRYAQMVAALGAEVTIEVQPALRELARCMAAGCKVGNGVPKGVYDFHCSLMDLPTVFRTTVESVPPPARPNLPDELKRLWLTRIPDTGRTRVGIVWAGNPKNSIDGRRSMKLEDLKPLFDSCPDTEFFSFQVGAAAQQLSSCCAPIADLAPFLGNFVDTAAALLRMDRVITIDTAVAHLAGSLGLDVWLLLPRVSCWRWLSNGYTSPWYPSMRLFRQPAPGDWESVVREICEFRG